MASSKPRFYWDTAPIIAWIKDEKRKDPAEMAGLQEVVELVERGKAIVMTSVLWRVEILAGTLTAQQRKRLDMTFATRSIQELALDGRVLALAADIRNYHNATGGKDKLHNVRVPDAMHLASAIHYEATEFHTFDGKKADGTSKGLITLKGNVAGHKLKICSPRASQLRLEFDSTNGDEPDDR